MPGNKAVPKKRSGQIDILMVDDNKMARAAWKKILQRSGQALIVGEITPGEFLRNIKQLQPPDVIIAGYSYVEKGFINNSKITKAWGYFPKTIIICENKKQVPQAFKSNADWAVAKPFNDQDLVTWVRIVSDEAKRLCEEYYANLSSMSKNENKQERHLKLIKSILQLLFHPDLVNPEKVESLENQPRFHARLVFRNQAKKGRDPDGGLIKFDEFWEDMRQDHQGKYIPIDVYNSEIAPLAVQELGKYLTRSHGLFGIIIGRGEVSRKISSLGIALYENEEKAVLLLGDVEIQEMLEYKAGGINPACLLKDLYQDLMVKAGS